MFSQIHKHKPHLILDNGINVYTHTHTHIYKERNGSDLLPSKCCLHVFFLNGILSYHKKGIKANGKKI